MHLRRVLILLIALFASLPACAAEPRNDRKAIPLLLDTDIGTDIDDAFALALILTSPELELRGVTTVGSDADVRALMVCRMLTAAGRREVPVAAGAKPQPSEEIKGIEKYRNHPADAAKPRKETAVEFLYQKLRERRGELTIVAIGPLTNLARLFREHPDCQLWIKRIVLMGGSVRVGYSGKAPPELEWNIKCDIKAAKTVFSSGVPLLVAPLDATTMLKMEEPLRRRFFAAKTPLTDRVHAIYKLWGAKTPVLYDPVAVALCFDEHFCTLEKLRLEVDDKGVTRILKGEANARVATSIRAEEFLRWYVDRVARRKQSGSGARLPDGFEETAIAEGINGATAMDFAPDGRLFVCEQTGALRIVKNDVLLPLPFLRVKVDSSWERGLLGVAFDADFAKNHFVYVNYISPEPYPHHRISRFTADGDRVAPGSEVILFEGDNQEKLGGGVKNGHQGGAIHFGPDGKLYVAIGDQTAGAPAQDLHTLQGKILRLNRDGSIPKDNPFVRQTTGKYRAIWALGLRNPFTFAFQPGSGRMFINDVGGANEEINVGAAGANYGWPTVEHGPTNDRRFRGPIHWYKESSIAGGAFYDPKRRQFPKKHVGKYIFADFKQGWIKSLDPEHPKDVRDFLTGLGNLSVVDIKIADDGSLYYLRRLAWVRDHEYRPNTGVLYKVRYTGAEAPASIAAEPIDQRVANGQSATFRIAAFGGAPLRCQWQREERDIAGATGETFTLPAATRIDSGARFRCIVRNAHGTAISRAARLTVLPSFADLAAEGFDGVAVSPRPGKYTGPITMRLSPHRPQETIRYTLDGREPNARSQPYRGPIALDRTTKVRFRRFAGERPMGRTSEAVFTIEGKTPYGLPYRQDSPDMRMPLSIESAPALLSNTGLFASLVDLKPQAGLIPYDVIAPLWSDGASKQRWMAPGRGPIGFAAEGEWTFPAGTVFVKHFELPIDERNPRRMRRLETRLLVVDGSGNGYGITYKWRPDNREADRLTDSLREDIAIQTTHGPRMQTWYYPSPADCLTCHTAAAKFVLGVKTRQLNRDFTYPLTGIRDNQLRTWNYLGLFAPRVDEHKIAGFRKLAALDDSAVSLTDRARSYLDANCSHCHRPGNILRATFDARFDTPLTRQGLLDAPTVSDSLNVTNPRVIACGDVRRSMLLHRMRRADQYRMPPVASAIVDRTALEVLERWIKQSTISRKP